MSNRSDEQAALDKLRAYTGDDLPELAETLVGQYPISARDFGRIAGGRAVCAPPFFSEQLMVLSLTTCLLRGESNTAMLVSQASAEIYFSYTYEMLRSTVPGATPPWVLQGTTTIIVAIYEYLLMLEEEAEKATADSA